MTGFERHLRETVGSVHTVESYLRDARQFEEFLSGRTPSIGAVEEWVRNLNHGARRPQTVQRKLTAVRRWLAWRKVAGGDAAAADVLDTLRDYKVSPPVRQSDRREVHSVTEAEFARVISVPRLRATTRSLLLFLWWSGARTSEAVGDPKAGIPYLSALDGLLLCHQGWTRTVGKGGRIRTLVLPQVGREELAPQVFRSASILRWWLWRRDVFGGGASAGDGSLVVCRLTETPLFQSSSGRPPSKQSINRSLHWAASLSDVRKFGAHALRHAYKARLRRAGVEAETIRRLMGHGPRSVTEAYGREEVDELLAAVQKLEVKT